MVDRGGRSRAAPAIAAAVAVLALVAAPRALGAVSRSADAAVHNVSNTPDRAEGEEAIAVDPLNPQNLIVGSNQFMPLTPQTGAVPEGLSGSQQAGVWASHDGGVTWTGGTINQGGYGPVTAPAPVISTESSDVGNFIGSDQSVVFDRHGTAYFESILSGFGPATRGDIQVIVHRSTDAGTTWQKPVLAFSQNATGILIDRPFLTIDNSGGPRDGTLYLGFETQFYAPYPSAVYVRASSDQGQTWGPVHRVDDDAHRAMWDPREYPVVGPDGALYVVYGSSAVATPLPVDAAANDIQLYVARSIDGGATFTRTLVEPHAHRLADPYEAIPAVQELISALAADPHRPGSIAVAWPDARSGEGRVLLRSSTDAGAHWSTITDIADDPAGGGNQHDHVALTYLPDGRLVAVWRDRRNGGGSFTGAFDIFARAFDVRGAPEPSGPVVRLTTSPQPPTTFPTGIQPSEYLAAAAGLEGVTATWDQMAGSLPDNVERRVPLSAFGSPAGLPAAAPVLPAPAVQRTPNTGRQAPPVPFLALVLCGGASWLGARRRDRQSSGV